MKVKEKNPPKKTNMKEIKEDIDGAQKNTEDLEFIENDTKIKKKKIKTNSKTKRKSKKLKKIQIFKLGILIMKILMILKQRIQQVNQKIMENI